MEEYLIIYDNFLRIFPKDHYREENEEFFENSLEYVDGFLSNLEAETQNFKDIHFKIKKMKLDLQGVLFSIQASILLLICLYFNVFENHELVNQYRNPLMYILLFLISILIYVQYAIITLIGLRNINNYFITKQYKVLDPIINEFNENLLKENGVKVELKFEADTSFNNLVKQKFDIEKIYQLKVVFKKIDKPDSFWNKIREQRKSQSKRNEFSIYDENDILYEEQNEIQQENQSLIKIVNKEKFEMASRLLK